MQKHWCGEQLYRRGGGGLICGGGKEVESEYTRGGLTAAQVSRRIPLFQAIPS